MTLRTVLLVLVAALPLTSSCAGRRAASGAAPLAPAAAGFYEGTLQSREHGAVPVTLNLGEASDTLAGTLFTPLGNFAVSQRRLTADSIALEFVLHDGDVGTIGGEWHDGEIRGTWALSDDGGTAALRRVGPPRPETPPRQPTMALSAAEWREDLRFLAAELPKRHGSAFHTVTRETFEDSVRALDVRLDSLRPHEVVAAMGRLVALVGDGHTWLGFPPTLRQYPVRLYVFGDTIRVTHIAAGHEHLLGARVLRIGATDIAEARRLVARQIGQENDQYVLRALPWFLTTAEILHANGVVPAVDSAQWTLATLAGGISTVWLRPVEAEARTRWVSGAQAQPLFRQRPSEELWYAFLAESRTLYVSFRGYPARPAFGAFFDEVFEFADRNPVERLVIELRENPGGDFNKGRDLVITRLKDHRLNQPGRLYVAIGRNTFSAAMTNAADFRRETNATLVGEATGGRPNGWQEKGEFTLPNSHLPVSVSTRYYEFLEEDVPAVPPHRHVPYTWDDYRAGRDPVLEWILAQPLPARR